MKTLVYRAGWAAIVTALVALPACRGCHRTPAASDDAGVTPQQHVEAPPVAPPTWQRKVERQPKLGRQAAAAQILLASERTTAPWAPPKTRKRTLEEARRLAAQLAERARAGADFFELAVKYSDWPQADRKGSPGYGGQLGVITESGSAVLPEAFKIALSLKAGEVSEPVESTFGVHVFKRLPAPRVSEILLTHEGTGQLHSPRTKEEAIELAHKIESELQTGQSFGDEAFSYSDDLQSAGRDGDLGILLEGSRVMPEIKQTAGRLAVGQVSAPIETPAGVMIVKRTE